jgi:hypothetical protein
MDGYLYLQSQGEVNKAPEIDVKLAAARFVACSGDTNHNSYFYG